jgi:NAD(P)-dependent dehydrogenase (short-subunit alcohol dehydrogenase family)
MSQTVLITGASSGIGKAAATLFADNGWNVVATMRNPDDGADLAERDNVMVTRLDLLDSGSIEAAVAAGLGRFGAIDVLLNNDSRMSRCMGLGWTGLGWATLVWAGSY